ncbi:unnamed protein product [Eruca vesicaria subsp. sativa]|uniref:Protein WVD2-like 7 n=1 Tax=Eruca vesicaria subsp. sativa TaxID=29727 RepID=A0ABC8LQN1_ERUVS|nr:unnamed protein product [Eruca vesicaria subsp. sativa]
MGESAVLFHSYSFAGPISRHGSHQDNTMHALSQSVSFGRFMTENLEWGKWSSFSHKKYVDEAEKYSQPGSVAQKKAFFDAHYKKIAEAKKAKDSKREPESVAVLLNTLETLTNDENKEEEEEESVETELVLGGEEVVLSIGKDDEEPERMGVVVVLEQEDTVVDNSVIADAVLEVVDENNIELLKKSSSVGEKEEEEEEERKSVTKNSSVAPVKAMELVVSQKISEAPITHSSMKKNKFSFLKLLMGNTKTQDQRKTDKKPKKMFLCLCFNPEMVGETEGATKTHMRNL